jgi:hypothetical protein
LASSVSDENRNVCVVELETGAKGEERLAGRERNARVAVLVLVVGALVASVVGSVSAETNAGEAGKFAECGRNARVVLSGLVVVVVVDAAVKCVVFEAVERLSSIRVTM